MVSWKRLLLLLLLLLLFWNLLSLTYWNGFMKTVVIVIIITSFWESVVTNVFKWFHENCLMANSSKIHFFISLYEMKSIQIQNSCIKTSSSEEPLGIKIDSNLTFHDHFKSLCSKGNKKLSALSRVSKYMGVC